MTMIHKIHFKNYDLAREKMIEISGIKVKVMS